MNVVKDLATIIFIIVATITLAGVYYSDTEEVDKRKKIFLKNIAIIVIVTIFLWMFCIFLLGSYFQTDLLTVLSLVDQTLLLSILLFVVSFSTGLFIQSRTNFLSTIDNDEITFTRIINRLTIKKKMNRSKLWRFNQEYLNPFLKSVTLGTYLLLGVLSVVLLFINHLDNEIKQFPFQSQERFYLKNVSDSKIYSIDTETDFDIIMTSVKKSPKLLYSIEDNVYSLPIENQKIKLKKGTKLFEHTKKSYLFLSNQYRSLEKEMKTAKSLIIPGIIGFVIFGLTFLLTNFYFFPFIIVILGGTIDIVLRQIFNINSLYIATILSILVGLYFLICIAIYDSGVISIHKSKDTIKSIKYQFKKFSYQIRKQNSIEKLLNGMTVGCRVVKFPYLVGENRTEPKIIFFIYQNYWDILRLPIWYFKCKYKNH